MENIYAEVVVFENSKCACYYISDGALIIYSSLDKIINNIPTNYLLIAENVYDEDDFCKN